MELLNLSDVVDRLRMAVALGGSIGVLTLFLYWRKWQQDW